MILEKRDYKILNKLNDKYSVCNFTLNSNCDLSLFVSTFKIMNRNNLISVDDVELFYKVLVFDRLTFLA